MDPLAEKYYSISPYAYCANNPVNRIDPTGMDWYTDNDGTRQYNPNIKSQDDLQKGQTYVGATYQVKDDNGNVTEDYRDDGSIMFSNEANGYKRIWNNTQKTGNEELGIIMKNGILVMPSWANGSHSAKVEDYGYSWDNGKLVDPVTKKEMPISGTIHTHPILEKDQKGNIISSWNTPSREDFTYAGSKTPNIPFYVITADRVVHANIPLTPDIATPLKLGKRGSTLEGIIYGHYSLKNIVK